MGNVPNDIVVRLMSVLEHELWLLSERIFTEHVPCRLNDVTVVLSGFGEHTGTYQGKQLSDEGDIILADGFVAFLNDKTGRYDGLDFGPFIERLTWVDQNSADKAKTLRLFIQNLRSL